MEKTEVISRVHHALVLRFSHLQSVIHSPVAFDHRNETTARCDQDGTIVWSPFTCVCPIPNYVRRTLLCTAVAMGYRTRATSGSRLGREHRQQQQQHGFALASLGGEDRPEDSLLRQGDKETAARFSGDAGGGEGLFDAAGENRVRTKSRRNKVRPSLRGSEGGGGGGGGGQEDRESIADWGNGRSEHEWTRSGGGGDGRKKERRPKSKARRGDRGDIAAGKRADDGEATGYPSLLDSALWKGGEEAVGGDARAAAGGSPGSSADLYDFGG